MCSYKCTGIALLILGVIFIALGLLMGLVGTPQILANELDKKIIPKTDAEGLAEYSEASDVPMFEAYHLFNLTNADLWLAGKAKPSVVDLGSYTMQVEETNLDPIVADGDGCSITFTRNRTYWSRPDESTRSDLDAIVYNLNPVLLGATVLFDGVVPAVQGALLPGILKMIMAQLSNFTTPSGMQITPESIAFQFSSLGLSKLISGSDTFENTPGLFELLGALPSNVTAALLSQLGGTLPKNFTAEPAAYFRDYPGKQITVKDSAGGETVLSIPSRQDVWPLFDGFTAEEGVMFFGYMNGTLIELPSISSLPLPLAMVLATQGRVGDGLIDEYVRMARNDSEDTATMPHLAAIVYTAMNFTTAPCQGNQTDICQRLAGQLNVGDGQNFAQLWTMTVLNDYFAEWANFALAILDSQNGGLVIKGTVEQWLRGFEPMAGMPVPGIVSPGPEPFTRTMHTGKCDRLDVGSWKMQGGKGYVDPRLYSFSCPDALIDENVAANCEALKIHGSDGTLFPRSSWAMWNSRTPSEDNHVVWVTEVNRYLPLSNTHNDVTIEGITLNHFVVPLDAFKPTAYHNEEYYGITCDGMLEGPAMIESSLPLLPSVKNTMLGLSRPHFLYADEACTSGLVEGLSPEPDLHDTFLDIEPYSGATMNVRKRLQANLLPKQALLGAINSKALYVGGADVTATVWAGPYGLASYAPIPYFYVEQRSTVTEKDADDFRGQVYTALQATFIVMIVLPILGALMAIVGIVMLVRVKRAAAQYGGSHVPKDKS